MVRNSVLPAFGNSGVSIRIHELPVSGVLVALGVTLPVGFPDALRCVEDSREFFAEDFSKRATLEVTDGPRW